jgi:hypothetical protein
MNEQLSHPFINDAAFRDAEKRVLGNILTQFEEWSDDELEELVKTNVDFLGNDHIRKIIGTTYNKEIESTEYTIGSANFNEKILSNTCAKMEGKWIISVDESIVDTESFVGEVMYRHSCAFGYKIPKISAEEAVPKEERILAVSSILRLQDEEDFDRKMALLTYMLNLYVAFYTAKILQSYDQPIYAVILHGPLIRLISPFLNLIFRKEDIKKVVTADTEPLNNTSDEIKTIARGGLLDSIVGDPVYQGILEQFIGLFSRERLQNVKKRIGEGEISGIGFYFSLLRKLSDLAKEMNFHLISCVENARSTECSKLYVQYQIERFAQDVTNQNILRKLFEVYGVKFSNQFIKGRFRDLIDKSGWDDEMIHAFSLKFDNKKSIESEFTQPVPIRRYFTCGRNQDIFGFRFGSSYISEDPSRETLINQIIDILYPFEDYRMLMSFVRTSALKAPIRVEFLEQKDEENWKEVLASIYISSLPYGSYGLPIFLYYADKMARMPKEIISVVTESYLVEQATRALHQLGLSDVKLKDVFLGVTQKFRRDFYERG